VRLAALDLLWLLVVLVIAVLGWLALDCLNALLRLVLAR